MERYWLYGITAESYKWCMKWEIPAQSTELNLCYLLWKSAQLQAEKLTQSRSYRLRKPKPTLSIFSPLCTWDKPGHGFVGEGRHAKLGAQQRCVGGWVRNFCACTSVRRRGEILHCCSELNSSHTWPSYSSQVLLQLPAVGVGLCFVVWIHSCSFLWQSFTQVGGNLILAESLYMATAETTIYTCLCAYIYTHTIL